MTVTVLATATTIVAIIVVVVVVYFVVGYNTIHKPNNTDNKPDNR